MSTLLKQLEGIVVRDLVIDGRIVRTAVRPGNPKLTPLLLCNGIGASLELLLPFAHVLDPDQEVILFDVPGIGGSTATKLPYRFSDLTELVTKILDELDYGKVNVLGISWGGFLAQQFAHDYPQRCKKLILAATSAGITMVFPSPRILMLMASPRRYTDSEYGAKIAPEIYGGSFRHNKELAKSHASKMKSSSTGFGYQYQGMAVWWWTSIHWLHTIKQPTLVLAGNDDPIIPLCNMESIAKRIPNSELHVYDDGHLFLLTQSESIVPLLTEFLSRES